MSSPCPCGSQKSAIECCQKIIGGLESANTAEQLMRARYSAHTEANIDFIVRPHHPVTRSEIDQETTQRWAAESDWLGLEIRNVDGGQADDESGSVEFVARYRDAQGRRHEHFEIALFEKLDGEWYFRDAEMPKVTQFKRSGPKQGRNDPCACGSGKKHKKCCGA